MSERIEERIQAAIEWKQGLLSQARTSAEEAETDYILAVEDLQAIRAMMEHYTGTEEEKLTRLYHFYRTLAAVC